RIIDRRHDDRSGSGCFLGGPGSRAAVCDDHIYLLLNEFSCQRAQFRVVLSGTCVNAYCAAFNVVELAKSRVKGLKQRVRTNGRRQTAEQGAFVWLSASVPTLNCPYVIHGRRLFRGPRGRGGSFRGSPRPSPSTYRALG